MPFAIFLVEAIIISLTGVMAPGPLTAVIVGTGTRSPHAGALVAIGHGIVEFPLMVLIYFGLGQILGLNNVKVIIFAVGGLFLLYMGIDMLRSIKHTVSLDNSLAKNPLVAGILLSIGNVFYLVWWATIGVTLIAKAVVFGLIGTIIFAVVHWLCDFIWFYFLSVVSFKGGHLFGITFQKVVFGICGAFLLLLSGKFLVDAGQLLFS